MKHLFIFIAFCCFGFANAKATHINKSLSDLPEDGVNNVLNSMIVETNLLQKKYNIQFNILTNKVMVIDTKLFFEKNIEKKVDFLIAKDLLKTQLEKLKMKNVSDISKIRYIKGLQIIKILYEKILGLDHHFTTVRTFSEISKMANPNQYPEFEKVNEFLKTKRDKKNSLDLSEILVANPIVSIVSTFSNILASNLSKDEKDIELSKIECILDFTLRMQNDLNTIYYDTAFLQTSNETVKSDLETLFKDYTKPIGYNVTIKDCRNQDDWDAVQTKLDNYLLEILKVNEVQKTKMQINIEFPIDRLIQFITQYNNFISEGVKFYQKFNIILNSYENEKQCENKLPLEFKKLKSEINNAIDKFNVAYKPVEINGSKMKEILYGINEFQ